MIKDEDTKEIINLKLLKNKKEHIHRELTKEEIELGEKRTGNVYDEKLKVFIRRNNNG